MDIVTRAEQRRRWPPDEELQFLVELTGQGPQISDVARRHETSRGLQLQWRDAQRRSV